jgi:CPA1 family monovalent cation:H+ antiporter
VGLAAAGIGIAYVPNAPTIPLSRDLIFNIFLPPLVFEAALHLGWRSFKRELPVTLLLAFVGVAIAALVVTAGMHWLVGWSWIGAAFFGVLIEATDPVSVIAS